MNLEEKILELGLEDASDVLGYTPAMHDPRFMDGDEDIDWSSFIYDTDDDYERKRRRRMPQHGRNIGENYRKRRRYGDF